MQYKALFLILFTLTQLYTLVLNIVQHRSVSNPTPANVADVQIGMKSANGSAAVATLALYDVATGEMIANSSAEIAEATSATDRYYSIKKYVPADATAAKTYTISFQNTGDGILSITNIKTTFTQKPATRIKMVRVTGSTGTTAKAMLEAYDEAQKPGQDVPGGEENPTTGDVALDAVVTVAMTACVLMLATMLR